MAVETLRRLEERFDRLESLLGPIGGTAVAPSLIVRGGAVMGPNPFEPLTGAVDDTGFFFRVRGW